MFHDGALGDGRRPRGVCVCVCVTRQRGRESLFEMIRDNGVQGVARRHRLRITIHILRDELGLFILAL
jgi:hypothetical protein